MKNPSDAYFMSRALLQAVRACGQTSPNPMVGAVLVKQGSILAEGFHRRAGLPHAEVEVLRKVKKPRGATLYVTLEPCCHLKKRTPPCTEALIRSGIRRVVVGSLDPNPQVQGRGVKELRKAGLQVVTGVLAEECERLNVFYNHWIQSGQPWVIMKSASSLDGHVALQNKQSKWITGEAAREWVHRLRARIDAVLVGVGTVLADDPRLTVRLPRAKRQPLRIVLDRKLRTPWRAKVLDKKSGSCCLVVDPRLEHSPKARKFKRQGVEVLACPVLRSGEFDLKVLLNRLGEKKIVSLLVEGGPQTWRSFLGQKSANEWLAFVAPKILGGDGIPLMPALQLRRIRQASEFQLLEAKIFGEDVLLSYRLK